MLFLIIEKIKNLNLLFFLILRPKNVGSVSTVHKKSYLAFSLKRFIISQLVLYICMFWKEFPSFNYFIPIFSLASSLALSEFQTVVNSYLAKNCKSLNYAIKINLQC